MASWQLGCPVEVDQGDIVQLGHGEGGLLMRRLIAERFLPRFGGAELARMADAAQLGHVGSSLAFTTDSYVVSPLFFPGGDIGRLAVVGTINDLAVAGATPRWLSLALIVEEGLPMAVLDCVLDSVAAAAREAEVEVIAGDTKVVPHGAADGLYVTTSGVGFYSTTPPEGPSSLQPGDELLITGPIGQHGIAVLCAREDFGFSPAPVSDCGSLIPAVMALREAQIPVRAMRDATRGGIAAVLHEWSGACGRSMLVDESRIPVSGVVRGVCELLGIDPMFVANEGTMVVAVPKGRGAAAVTALTGIQKHCQAAVIGSVQARSSTPVLVQRALGRAQPLDEPLGAPLPRIC